MAIIQKVQLVSDLSGEEILEGEGRTVQLGFDGTTYELELTNSEIDQLSNVLQPYIKVARKAGGTQRRRRGSASAGSGYDAKAVRKWAESQGIEISPRGRIPADVLEKYRAAGN